MAVLFLGSVFVVSRQAGLMSAGLSVTIGKEKPIVVIDAGDCAILVTHQIKPYRILLVGVSF